MSRTRSLDGTRTRKQECPYVKEETKGSHRRSMRSNLTSKLGAAMRLGADVDVDGDGGECVESTFLTARDLSTLYDTTLKYPGSISRLLRLIVI